MLYRIFSLLVVSVGLVEMIIYVRLVEIVKIVFIESFFVEVFLF